MIKAIILLGKRGEGSTGKEKENDMNTQNVHTIIFPAQHVRDGIGTNHY